MPRNMQGRNRKPSTARRLKNMNRIVRVYDQRTNNILQAISDDLGCPYQLVFDELLGFYNEELNYSSAHVRDMITNRLLHKYTGRE